MIKMLTKKELFAEEVECLEMCLKEEMVKLTALTEPFALGHGFVWCRVNTAYGSAKILLGSVCSGDLGSIQNGLMKLKEKLIPELDYVWINLD